ncbi:MAG TPA: M48 family metalloprotease [Rhodanobacteraceae bacterium]|nr:M48 family metalloprotease [Rhodanobacteraceae bacterium]
MLIRQLATGLLGACLAIVSGAAGAQDHVRLPDLGGSAQAMLSPQEARQYGASMLHQMRAMHMVLDDPLVHDYLNDVGYRLVAHSDKPTQKFTFFVVNTQVINAFAAPGGYIGVNAGLIDLTHSEDELAAVMAHEIGHITQHHLERAFEASKKDAPLMALVLLGAIAAGAADSGNHGYAVGYNGYNDGSSNAAMGVLAAGMGLIQQRQINFTRKDEIEADRTGIQTLAAAGYNPEAMASFFQRMEETLGGEGNVPALLQTHPVTLNRIADAKARARMLDSQRENAKVPPISQKQWEKITAPIRYVSNPGELMSPGDGNHGKQIKLYALMRERVRVLSQDASKAVDYYRDRMHRPGFDSPANRYGYALALTRDHQSGPALAQIKPLVAKYPSSLPVQLALADALDQGGHQAEALDIYARLNAGTPHDRAIVLAYADALIGDKSEAHARKAAELIKPLLNDADEPQIFETYARASEIAGSKVDAGEAWANASYLSGRPFDAMEQLRRLLKRKDLNYYQRARIQADVDQLRPILLELQKRHIQTKDRNQGNSGRTGLE